MTTCLIPISRKFRPISKATQPPLTAPTNGIRPLAVTFTDTSTGPANSWLWNFGDTLTSTQQHPTHNYTTAGVYTIWGCIPLTVKFINASTGDYSDSLWNFGDYATSALTSPTHAYTMTGAFTVTLTVSGRGGTDTESKTAFIKTWPYCVHLPIALR